MDLTNKYVITINRELGSGGRTVGEKLAAKLGVPFYDKAHIKAIEEKYSLSVDEIEKLKGKKKTWWTDIKKMVELDGNYAVSVHSHLPELAATLKEKPDSGKIFQAELEMLQGIADTESCVLAGRCGFFALKDHPNHLSILIQSPMEQRVERLVKKGGVDAKEAKKIIETIDKQRELYVSQNTGTSRYDTRNYDLVISMAGKTEDEAVDIILKFIGK
ncbi:MAG: cytidylate kinase-like family protein [Bacteroidales bacterium]|nr:cytidylate kinase-like family protein [Bacteroidales bacterium]